VTRLKCFNRDELRQGMVVRLKSDSMMGKMVMKMLKVCWSSHDAIVIIMPSGRIYVGDAQPITAKLTPIEEYDEKVASGAWKVKFLLPEEYTHEKGMGAAEYWIKYVKGTVYDIAAFPRLALKCIFGDIWKKAAGWEWANWCTEGVAVSWLKGGNMNLWKKTNPTPLTTQKRQSEGVFNDLTKKVVKRGYR